MKVITSTLEEYSISLAVCFYTVYRVFVLKTKLEMG